MGSGIIATMNDLLPTIPRHIGLTLSLCLLLAGLPGCAAVTVAGAVTGAAISVAGAVVSTGVTVTGKVVGKAIDVALPDGGTAQE